jgi:hypothetical protein
VLGTGWRMLERTRIECNSTSELKIIDLHIPSTTPPPPPGANRNLYSDPLVKKFPSFCGIKKFFTVFTRKGNQCLSDLPHTTCRLNVTKMGRITFLLPVGTYQTFCSCVIHSSVICQTTGPQPLPERFLHLMRSRASSFK